MARILVTSIPAWSKSTGYDSFSTLFEGNREHEIANLYMRAELPDSEVCSQYFRILEGKVVKSVFWRNITTGSCVTVQSANDGNAELKAEKKRYAYFSKNRNSIFLLGRELAWKMGNWKSNELKAFLGEYHPDILVFPIESYIYFNRINEFIIDYCKPKRVIGILWDDNFTYKQNNKISYKIGRFFTRRSVKRLVKKCDEILTVCPKMKKECDSEFGINSTIVTKPIISLPSSLKPYTPTTPLRLIYTGKLNIGRDKAIMAIVRALKIINQNGCKAYIDIYTQTDLTDEQVRLLTVYGTSFLKGVIPQNQVKEEQAKSDILVFVEDIYDKHNKTARLSFSTKITDYLSQGRCILAIGPSDIASIEYFSEEKAAIVCNVEDEILKALQRVVDSSELLTEYAVNARLCGERNHSMLHIKTLFMEKLLGESL